MNLVLVETMSNQDYIFSTNKLKENVGASQHTFNIGDRVTLKAVARNGGPELWAASRSQTRQNIAVQPAGAPVEVIVATSGKALLLVDSRERGRNIVSEVTARAIRKAPGLRVFGMISEEFDLARGNIHEINMALHQRGEADRWQHQQSDLRFMRLPVVKECETSGLPAKTHCTKNNIEGPSSAVRISKVEAAKEFTMRVTDLLNAHGTLLRAKSNLDELESQAEGSSYVAVIHADGNGFGQIFTRFEEYSGLAGKLPGENASYIDRLRRFSLAIEECAERAFVAGLNAVERRRLDAKKQIKVVPLVPLVLGGDDFTGLCLGEWALPFTAAYLKAFEAASADPVIHDGIIRDIAQRAFGTQRLGASAGIALVKHHYPFHSAYRLANDLAGSAKEVKEKLQRNGKSLPCSSLDFHVLHDSAVADLKRIRARMHARDRTPLFTRPLIVTEECDLAEAPFGEWRSLRRWETLEKNVALLNAEEEGRRRLPNSQMHYLRDGLAVGQREADARLGLILERYREAGLEQLLPAKKSLFVDDGAPGSGKTATLLDAMEASAFFPGALANGGSNGQE